MSLVIDPLSFILIAVNVPESSLAMCFVEVPVALVARSILPNLDAVTVSVLVLPLTRVLGSILEHKLGSILNLTLVVAFASLKLEVGSALQAYCLLPHKLATLHNWGRLT